MTKSERDARIRQLEKKLLVGAAGSQTERIADENSRLFAAARPALKAELERLIKEQERRAAKA